MSAEFVVAVCALAWVLGVLAVRYALTRSVARENAAERRAPRGARIIAHPFMRPTRQHFLHTPLPRQTRRSR
jgi:hypothetical protein